MTTVQMSDTKRFTVRSFLHSIVESFRKSRFDRCDYATIVKADKGVQNRGLFQLWLLRDGVTVGYLHYRLENQTAAGESVPVIDVWEVETRPECRNQGVSRKLVEAARNHCGVDRVVNTGGYTPDGAAFFARYCDRPAELGEPHIHCQSGFVADWDEQRILPSI